MPQCEFVPLVPMTLYEVRSLRKVDRARKRVEFRRVPSSPSAQVGAAAPQVGDRNWNWRKNLVSDYRGIYIGGDKVSLNPLAIDCPIN